MSAKAGIKSTSNRSDFSQGSVWGNIMYQSLPLIVAQLVQLLYNVIDRVYIGHLPVVGSTALTGIGLAFPLTTCSPPGVSPSFPWPEGRRMKSARS